MEGTTVSHYHILEKIGEGGMGEVYLAEDTTLERKVALKFLPEVFLKDKIAPVRFSREAKAAAAIDHPFICKIYEVGELEKRRFIAMEYVEGETLKDRLDREPLTYREVLRMGSEIAEALQRAHEEGIVHRDLKPSNIMLTRESRVKVMDFGLAKRVAVQDHKDGDTTAALTREGTTLGTVPYMSPEQLRGEEVDARSDIFSFGILLYEMLLGEHPFKRDTPTQTAAAILETEPVFPSGTPAEPGGTLHRLLAGLLMKDRNKRCQSVGQVREELVGLLEEAGPSRTPRWLHWAAGIAILAVVSAGAYYLPDLMTAPSEAIESIAVLRFETRGEHPHLELLGDGIPASIIDRLAPIVPVVKAAASSFQLSPDIDPQEAARQLGVSAVVMGQLIASESGLVIATELIDAKDSRRIWGRRFPWKLTEVYETEEAVARQVVAAMSLQLTPEQESRLSERPTENEYAWIAYTQGRLQDETREGITKTIEHYKDAVQLDPEFALAYSRLANAYFTSAFNLTGPSLQETMGEVKELAEKAVELDPSLAEPHLVFARLRDRERDWEGVENEVRKALELNPGIPEAHGMLAHWVLAPKGRLDEALKAMKRAHELDSLSHVRNFGLGLLYYLRREWDEAFRYLKISLDINPTFWMAHYQLGELYVEKGMLAEAQKHFEMVTPDNCPICAPPGAMGRPYVMAMLGKTEEALAALRTGSEPPQELAKTYAVLGEVDLAIEYLQKVIRSGSPLRLHLGYLKTHPMWDPLRSDPRFTELLREAGLEP